ncbi:universal stress protein [soil metagenome]
MNKSDEPTRGMMVVLATDGSEAADVALDLAASIEWPQQSVIRLVTAVEPVEAIMPSTWLPDGAAMDPVDALAVAAQILEQGARRLARSGARIEIAAVRGRPATQVIGAASDNDADLIMIGSRGHGQIASMLLGSVSAEVVDHAPCPVLVARTPLLTRAILGVDGSGHARAAEEIVATWSIFAPAAIEVASVASVGLPWTSSIALLPEMSSEHHFEIGRRIVDDHRLVAEDAAARLVEAGRKATAHVIEGDPARELVNLAERVQADLIVVGTHGRTGLTRAMLGSVARNVLLHAPCSVLVVRTEQPEPGDEA